MKSALASAFADEDRRERVVVCPGKLPEDFWTWLPDVQRIGANTVDAEPEAPLPLPTARVTDELLWRSALAKIEAAKVCAEAARAIERARETQRRAAACRAARVR